MTLAHAMPLTRIIASDDPTPPRKERGEVKNSHQRNIFMSNTEIEIVLDDPTAPEPDSPPVADTRTVDVIVSLLLLAVALTLGYDNWRTGISWDSTGPQAGYFPFYLSAILGRARLYG